MNKIVYFLILLLIIFPFEQLNIGLAITPAISLLIGLIYALIFPIPFAKFNKKASKYLLQVSVVGLGFGMNIIDSLKSGSSGMLFTIASVVGVMALGVLLGRWLNLNRKTSYLISSGTAICGGSAIAAVGPVIEADDDQMSMSLATIFILNAIALFIFPPVGQALGLSQEQFGVWAAIAIHDTSSVVGAGSAYGEEALKIATTVKLTRALWIIPLALVSSLIFRSKGRKVSIPWFIVLFVIAMIINTFIPIPVQITGGLVFAARKLLCITLFLIGGGLSLKSIKKVGAKPLALGITLWFLISVVTLAVVMWL
jgi:uncharacterized integral membrane protein (TIGR00698 family)